MHCEKINLKREIEWGAKDRGYQLVLMILEIDVDCFFYF